MFNARQLQSVLQSQTKLTHFVVAYSGGLDSHVLLHAMQTIRKENTDIQIEAVHVNHQLNPLSPVWENHCRKTCTDLNILFYCETVRILLRSGDSVEEQARLHRYSVLKKYVNSNRVLLTAHTLNDQAETFLLQALRGSGLKGLSAMPVKKNFGDGLLIRPLLSFSREQLEQYAQEYRLHWIEDDSNIDQRFDRNFLRHQIFPLLKKRWPQIDHNFLRCARLAAESEQIIVDNTHTLFELIQTNDSKKIKYKPLKDFSDIEQRLLLRYWLHKNHCRLPSEKQLKQIQRDVLNASSDAKPRFVLGDVIIQRDHEDLLLCSQS